MGDKKKFLPTKKKFASEEDVENYVTEIIYELQDAFNQLNDSVDGNIKSSAFQQNQLWTPTLNGMTNTGTFTYTRQVGWVFRQGLLVDVWGDIMWSNSGTATGNLFVELPYKVANTDGYPFIGPAEPSSVTMSVGRTAAHINAIANTFRGEFVASGSGVANDNIQCQASGELRFHIRYLGVRNE